MHNRQTTFCALEHKRAANDLDKIRGRVLTKLVQTWRKGKKTRDVRIKDAARFAFQEICALGDLYNQEDAKDGRPSAVAHTQIMIAAGRKPSVDR
jgi:3-methyladenine DNA glycosylase AlkC